MSKKMKNNKKNNRNFRIEALEPRLLMDADNGHLLDEWKNEIETCVEASEYITGEKALANDTAISGLFVNDANTGKLRRATISDVMNLDTAYFSGNDVTDAGKIVESIQSHLMDELEKLSDTENITAEQVLKQLDKTSDADSHDASWKLWDSSFTEGTYRTNIYYDVVSNEDGKITVNATATTSLSDTGISEFVNEVGKLKDINEAFSADISGTCAGIEAAFSLDYHFRTLEFSFTLDGLAGNGVDMNSTEYLYNHFNETKYEGDSSINAKFGVLDLSGDSDNELIIAAKLVVDKDGKASVIDGMSADMTFGVRDVDDTFVNDENLSGKFTYTRTLANIFNEDDTGTWSNEKILDYNTFSMGKILEKLQAVSSRLSAIQCGEYGDQSVDFGSMLSKNAVTLMNLSAMLDDVINNPPESLQELVERINSNPYNTANVENAVNDTKNSTPLKIVVQNGCISIPFSLTYFEEDENGDVSKELYSNVALSESTLSNLFCAEVVENKTVEVKSSATLSFNLVIPFVNSENAVSSNELYELGLDETNDQLATVIGANALVGEAMELDFGGMSDLAGYANLVASSCGNAYAGYNPSAIGYCLNSSESSYALFFSAESSISNYRTISEDDVVDAASYFNPTKLNEFKGVSASKGLVLQWNSSYDTITYKNISKKLKDRSVSSTEEAVSALNALFAQSKCDEVKDAHAIAFDNYIVILINDNADVICEDLNDNLTIKSESMSLSIDSDIFDEDNLQEIWISNALSPIHYNDAATMTVTVGNESFDLEFNAGYFNSATCVADIAASLQEMINGKFRWNTEDLENGIEYESPKIFVEAFDGKIRFVSSQDYSIDFHSEAFAQWLGFNSYALATDENEDSHVLMATSSEYVEHSVMKSTAATIKFHETSKYALRLGYELELPENVELSILVGGVEKTISLNQNEYASLKWAGDLAEILQEKIDEAFGWDSERKIFIVSENDRICFKSLSDFSISVSNSNVARWMGFNTFYSSNSDDRAWIVGVKEYVSEIIEIDNFVCLSDKDRASETFTINIAGSSWTFGLEGIDFAQFISISDVAKFLQQKYNDEMLSENPDAYLEIYSVSARICFKSALDFSMTFSDNKALWLFGFGEQGELNSNGIYQVGNINDSVDVTASIQKEFTDCVKTSCMEIDVITPNGLQTVSVDLKSMADDCFESDLSLKNVTIGAILTEIKNALNAKLGDEYFVLSDVDVDGGVTFLLNESVAKAHNAASMSIYAIRDVNGFTLASLLGLSGTYGTDVESERSSFAVTAFLVDDYITDDSKVALYENFNLSVVNTITQGKVDIPLAYGVFGETVHADLTGTSCTTSVIGRDNNWKTKIRLKDFVAPSYNYTLGSGNWYWSVTLDDGLSGNTYVGGVNFWTSSSGMEHYFYGGTTLNTEGGVFCNDNYSMGDLCEDLGSDVPLEWENQFLSDTATSTLSNVELPISGKSIVELMGLQQKIQDYEAFLTSATDCSSIQELIKAISDGTGIAVTAQYYGTTIALDFVWNVEISNKLVELDTLDFNRDDFVLSGQFKTYLNANLTFKSHVELDGSTGTILVKMDSNRTTITGEVSMVAKNINADMVASLYRTDDNGNVILEEASLQVESQTNKSSDIYLKAVVGTDQNVQMNLGGSLYVYKYGEEAGVVKIGVASADGDVSGASSWNGEEGNNLGSMVCTSTPNSVAALGTSSNATLGTDGVSAGNIVLDLSAVKDLNLVQTTLFDKLKQSVDGLGNAVRRLQSSLYSTLSNSSIRNIPLIGDSIINVGDGLSFLNTSLVEPLRKYVYSKAGNLNALAVAEKLSNFLNGYIPVEGESALAACDENNVAWWAQKQFNNYYKGIQYYESSEEAYWHLRLQVEYTLDENGNFDIGFPGLGLKAEGGVYLSFTATLDIGFGVSLKDGAFLLLSNGYDKAYSDSELAAQKQSVSTETADSAHVGDDLVIKFNIVPNAQISGSLGFLTMAASLEKMDQSITLGVDLNDGDGYKEDAVEDWENDKSAKSVISFKELRSAISTETNLRGKLDLELPMTLGIGGYGSSAPHIDTTFNMAWSADFGDGFGSVEKVGFGPIVFDCGSFVKNTVGGLVEKINRVLQPVQPLINFLQAEIPVLNKLPAGKVKITVLDLVKKFGDMKGMDFGFLDDIIEMQNVVQKLNTFANKGLMLSGWTIYDKTEAAADNLENKVMGATMSGLDFLNGKITDVESFITDDFLNANGITASIVNRLGSAADLSSIATDVASQVNGYVDYAKNTLSAGVDAVSNVSSLWNTATASSTTNVETPEFGGNWSFPIIDEPATEIMKLMMGGHANLVVFDMRPLKFNFDWSKSFPIIGPLCADVGFSFGVNIDLCFGYDTYGAERWACSNFCDYGALIDGFFVSDWDLSTGEDVSEVMFHSGVVAGASVCGRFGVNVGLNLNVDLDFKDPNNDGKIRLTEMADMLSLNPLDTFDVSASISARAFAYLDLFFYRKEWTLWSSGAFDLFNTAKSQGASVASKNGEDLVVNVGDFAANRNVDGASEDGADEVTVDVTDSKKVKITIQTDGENKVSNSYTISGDNLCIYAGECDDKITIKGKNADFNVIVYGGNGNDTVDLSGLTFADGRYAIVMGGAGSDTIKGAASGSNYLFGETGIVAYTPATQDEKKKVSQVAAYLGDEDSDNADIIVGGTAASESTSLETVIFGGDGSDLLVGGSGENHIFGDYGRLSEDKYGNVTVDRHDVFDEGGNDLIYGNNGIDHIYGGAGDDLVSANGGNDEIYGGQGNDVIYGGSGDDEIYGNEGTDVIFGDTPFDSSMTIARSDDDTENGAQLPYGFVPHDLKNALDASGNEISPFFSTIHDEKSNSDIDVLKLFDFAEEYIAKNFPEDDGTLADMELPKETKLSNGSDTIDGGDGSDVIFGDDGRNASDSSKNALAGGSDTIDGGNGNDFIDGDAGNDTIDAGSGVDIVYGGRGSDKLDGGEGNDFVFGDDGLADYSSESLKNSDWFGIGGVIASGEDVFGETISSVGKVFGISDKAESVTGGGEDTIIAGNGNDFVDGQSGNDTYKVQFMGSESEIVTNVMDSGDDTGDSMNILGTLANDNVLIRSSDAGLGLVALLPNDSENSALERVNYWRNEENGGVDSVSVETRSGDDTVSIDSTLTAMSVFTDDGDDSISVGQCFDANSFTQAQVNSLYSFKSSIYKTSKGILSAGATQALTISGGIGDDHFDVLHTNAPLTLFGNIGDDEFNIYSFVDGSSKAIANNGQISIIGGDQATTYDHTSCESHNGALNIYGLPYASTYLLNSHNLVTANMDVFFMSLRYFNLYGSSQDDTLYTFSLASIDHNYYGNGGNDKAYRTSNDALIYDDFNIPQYATPTGVTEESVRSIIANELDSKNTSINVVTVDANGNDISSHPYISVDSGTTQYGVKLSQKPTESVTVRISVATLPGDDIEQGDAGMALVDDQGNYCKYIDLVFTSKNYNTIQYVKVAFRNDNFVEQETISYLQQDVIDSPTGTVVKSSNVLVFSNDSNRCKNGDNGFTETLDFKISDCTYDKKTKTYSLEVILNEGFAFNMYVEALKSEKPYVWGDAFDDSSVTKTISGNILKLTWESDVLDDDSNVHINYFCYGWALKNESSAMLKYYKNIHNKSNSITFDLKIGSTLYSISATRDESSDGYFYKMDGDKLTICSNETGEPTLVTGMLYLTNSNMRSYIVGDTPYSKVLFNSSDYNYLYNLDVTVTAPEYSLATAQMLPGESSATASVKKSPAFVATAAAAQAIDSSTATAENGEIELQESIPSSVSLKAGETVCLKVPVLNSLSTSSNAVLMVNSEDGAMLPAMSFSYEVSGKKCIINEEEDLSYLLDLSNASIEDDFIYVYLHAAKDCRLMASTFAG